MDDLDYVPTDDEPVGGVNPLVWVALVSAVEIALAVLWVFRASIWS